MHAETSSSTKAKCEILIVGNRISSETLRMLCLLQCDDDMM